MGGQSITFDARQRPHLVIDTAQGVDGASPSGNPMALSLGLEVHTKDPEGEASMSWMKISRGAEGEAVQGLRGQAGCDLTGTQLQASGTSQQQQRRFR